ncbi:MAG: hypothetical protein ACYTGL_10810 [Planctomycetota bacterium]
MSFSSAPVRDLLNTRFENSFLSSIGESSAGSSVGHAPTDSAGPCSRGIGRQNVQCLFMTPDGRLFHTVSGFRSPDDLLLELQFALKTFESIRKSPGEGPAIVAQVHKQRLLDGGFSEEQIRRPANSPFAMTRALSDLGRPSQGGSSLSSVEGAFAAKTRQAELADGQFMMSRPLIPFADFLKNPRQLTGNESSAFSSTSNGGASGGKIGN